MPELLNVRCSCGHGIFRVFRVHLVRLGPTSRALADREHARRNYRGVCRAAGSGTNLATARHGCRDWAPRSPGSLLDCMLRLARIAPGMLKNIDSHDEVPLVDPGTDRAHNSRMRSGPALPLPLGTVILLATLALGGCGSSGAGNSSAGGSGQTGGASQAGEGSAGDGVKAGTAGTPGTSGAGGSGGGVPIAGASSSAGGAMLGASGSGGHGTPDMSDPSCPATLPAPGATCSTAGVCNYSDCAGVGRSIATCDGVKFSVTTDPCQSEPCGTTGLQPLYCLPNEICIEHQAGNSWHECRPDPCAPGAQACSCASALCGANSSCSFQNFKLVCGCPGSCA